MRNRINNNVAKLAKTKKPTVNTPIKTDTKKTVDEMAKEKVIELLSDVDLNPHAKMTTNLSEIDFNNKENLEWLQEQVTKLTENNEKLSIEAAEAKENYNKLFSKYEAIKNGSQNPTQKNELMADSEIKNKVISLFIEFQNNYFGKNQERRKYSEIKLFHLMGKLVKSFPFLKEVSNI
jgi:hypothetical protein